MRCYIEPSKWDKEEASLSPEESHHVAHVLRAEPGTKLEVFDGRGSVGVAELIEPKHKVIKVRILEREEQPFPAPAITLFQAVIREQKMDLIVQKGTEIGVSSIAPFITHHSVVQLTEKKAAARKERWDKIALGAAKQSGNIWLPEIDEPVGLAALLKHMKACDLLLVCSLEETSQSLSTVLGGKAKQADSIGVFIGPEGDFTKAELEQIKAAGALPVSLGESVLRAETAALYVLSVLRYVLGR